MHLRNRQQTVLGPFVHPSSKGTVNREEGQKQQQKRGPQEDALLCPEGGDGPRSIILSLGAKEEEEETAWQLKEGGRVRQRMRTHSTTDAHLHGRRGGCFPFFPIPVWKKSLFSCPSVASASSRSEGLLTSVPLSCDFYTFQT